MEIVRGMYKLLESVSFPRVISTNTVYGKNFQEKKQENSTSPKFCHKRDIRCDVFASW